MDEGPKLSPFQLTRSRIVLLVLGALLLVIAISTAMGGLSSYQQLKEASAAAKAGTEAAPAADTPIE